MAGGFDMANDGGVQEQVAAALSKSELRFRTLVGAVSAITWSCPSSGLHVEPQPEWMAFTGQSAEEMLGDGWTNAVHPDDRARAASEWREAVARAAPYEAEVRIRRHDGEWRWMSVRAVPICDASGGVAEWFGMNIDITEQKNAAEALRKSEERFRLFADNSPTISWMKDEDGRFVYFSRTYERSFGVEAADWLGKTDADLWPPGAAQEFRRNDQLVLSAGHPIEIVEETLRPDGSRCSWLVTKFPFCDADGKRYVGGIGLDITGRRRMEAALRASERRFRAVFNNQSVYVVLVSPEGRIVEMSESILRGTGVAAKEMVGEFFVDGPWWNDLPEMRERWRRQFDELLARPGPSQDEAYYWTRDGELRFALNTVTALHDEKGDLEFFLCEGLDITERKRAENALRESEELLRRVYDNADVGLTRCSRDWAYLSANPAYAKIVGKPLSQIIDRPIVEVMGAEAAETIRPHVERVLRGEHVAYEAEMTLEGAGHRYLHVSYTPEADASGQIVGWVACVADVTERKRAEIAQRESEERLRLALDASRAGSWSWNVVSNLATWDDRYHALYELPPDAPRSFETWVERLHPDDRIRMLSRIEAVRASPWDNELNEDYRSISAEGRVRWHQGLGRAQRDAAGKLVKLVGIDLDISERKHAEEALRESEERLRRVSDNADVGLIRTNRELIYLSANPAYAKIVGKPLEQIVGRPLSEVMGAQAAESIRPYVERVLRGERFSYEAELRYAGAGKRYVQVSNAPELDAAGEVGSWVTCIVDLTERKRAEIALRASERRFRVLFKSQLAFSTLLSPEGRLVDMSDSCVHVAGATLEELVGLSFVDAPWWQDLPETRESWRRQIEEARTRPGPVLGEIAHRMNDGELRYALNSVTALRDEQGELEYFLCEGLDITERRRAEAALREADRRKDEFIATLAHELRNPLAPVRNGLEALRNLGAQDTSSDRLLAVMEGQVDHLIRLVDDLMDISRISRGKFELKKQRMDLATALRQAVNMSRHLIEAEDLDLMVNLPCSPTPIEGDTVRLAQVFANLLSNAAKHTTRGGRIEISLERVGDEAVARVADTGAGIATALLPLIFEPFVQGGGRSGGAEQGLGIGLALVRQITEMHGGSVEARSEGEGLGSVFIVRLPLLEAEATEAPVKRNAPARLATPPRILVIDDMPEVAEALAFLLDVLGATVRVAHSGAEGLQLCASFEPDLVLLDLSMPLMDGFETARRLRELPAGRRAKLVAVTGFGERQSRARTQEVGFESHLVKPVRLQQLEELLASLGAGAAQQTSAE